MSFLIKTERPRPTSPDASSSSWEGLFDTVKVDDGNPSGVETSTFCGSLSAPKAAHAGTARRVSGHPFSVESQMTTAKVVPNKQTHNNNKKKPMRASSRFDQQMKVEMSQIRRMKAVTLWFLDDKK